MAPLQLVPPVEFDSMKHNIDDVAQKYLKQASTSVQHFIAVKSHGDGNCLFNSIVALIPDSEVSAIELRGTPYCCIYSDCITIIQWPICLQFGQL
jgi:hypothetical protein